MVCFFLKFHLISTFPPMTLPGPHALFAKYVMTCPEKRLKGSDQL